MPDDSDRRRPDRAALDGIEFLVMDVDGVLTDGSQTYSRSGEEVKVFNVRDGTGVAYWLRAGRKAGIISGRSSPAITSWAGELGIGHVAMGVLEKLPAMEAMLEAAGVTPDRAAVIGDDLIDIPMMRPAGLAVAVADAQPEVRAFAHYVTRSPGGRGAVRETVEMILKAQGRWADILARYGL